MNSSLNISGATFVGNYSGANACLSFASIILKMPVAVKISRKKEFVLSPNLHDAEKIIHELDKQMFVKGSILELARGFQVSGLKKENTFKFAYRFSNTDQETKREICFYFFSEQMRRISTEKKKWISELSRMISHSIPQNLPLFKSGIKLHTMQPQLLSGEDLPWFNKK